MQPHLISDSGISESAHYRAIDREEMRERALESLKEQVRQDVKAGEPQTSNAYADHCSTFFERDLQYALCLARINGDTGLLQQALAELDKHIASELAEFVDQESSVRRLRLLAQAEQIAMESCA